MVPEWLAVVVAVFMFVYGFLACGALIGTTPFWDGVRDGLTFNVWKIWKQWGKDEADR